MLEGNKTREKLKINKTTTKTKQEMCEDAKRTENEEGIRTNEEK